MSALTASTRPHLVHGMGTQNVTPDWPPLTLAEVDKALRGYPEAGGASALIWRSPRPLSAAGLVETRRGGRVFVKRHHQSVRSAVGLHEEHAFLAHLRRNGAAVVRVLADDEGGTALSDGEWTYEVHTVGVGDDLYRDAISWSPFTQPGHARAAGRALAHLHEAAHGYDAPPRTAQPLVAGFSVFASDDPFAALEQYAAERPAVAAELAERPWRADLERRHLPFHARLSPLLAELGSQWTHNDLHASNLLWHGGEVATVLDFGLCERAFAAHDLATAIERNAVEWLELDEKGAAAVHLDAAVGLVQGYQEVRRLTDAERAALPELLALCHADYALSEIDYFRGVTGSPRNTELAYRYLVDHTAWFAGPVGGRFLADLRKSLG
ncbi:MAG: phosphotransferase enzyme family protein [Actinocrinis sp.]